MKGAKEYIYGVPTREWGVKKAKGHHIEAVALHCTLMDYPPIIHLLEFSIWKPMIDLKSAAVICTQVTFKIWGCFKWRNTVDSSELAK